MEMFIVILLEVVSGLSSSVFIIICLSCYRCQRANITPLNRILISLNVSNGFLVLLMLAYYNISSFRSYLFSIWSVFYFFTCMSMFTTTSSSWLTAILCFFYFVKIMPSRPGVITDVKNKIGAIVWKLIFVVGVVSTGGSFILALYISLQHQTGRNSTLNEGKTFEENIKQKPILIKFVMIFNCLPFLVVIMTTIASAWFLRVYDSQIKKNNGTLANSNVKDYRSAVYTMMGLLILYMFVIVTFVIRALNIFVKGSLGFWICEMVLLSFPTGQPVLLIYSNPKLKQILKDIFTSLTCRGSGE